MKINTFGQVEISETEAFEALYTKKITDLSRVYIDSESIIDQYNTAKSRNADRIPELQKLNVNLTIDQLSFDEANQCDWFMPEEYKNMDIEAFLIDQCPKQNYERLVNELVLFRQHNMILLLRYLKYLVDTMRSNSIVWGVGRGSSVASYVLYLLGVHKVDSIKYDLDINEFLR